MDSLRVGAAVCGEGEGSLAGLTSGVAVLGMRKTLVVLELTGGLRVRDPELYAFRLLRQARDATVRYWNETEELWGRFKELHRQAQEVCGTVHVCMLVIEEHVCRVRRVGANLVVSGSLGALHVASRDDRLKALVSRGVPLQNLVANSIWPNVEVATFLNHETDEADEDFELRLGSDEVVLILSRGMMPFALTQPLGALRSFLQLDAAVRHGMMGGFASIGSAEAVQRSTRECERFQEPIVESLPLKGPLELLRVRESSKQ